MKKIQFLIPAFALAALAFAGCSDDDTNNEQPAPAPKPVVPATELKFADDAQAALTFVAVDPEAQTILLNTDAEEIEVEQVLAEEEVKAGWCSVTVLSAKEVKVAPISNPTTEERSIKYRISAEGVEPLEFTVTQEAGEEEVKNTLSVNLEAQYGSYTFTAPAAGGQITVATVSTDAAEWTAELDPGYGDTPYCSLQTASGANGEALVVVFEANTNAQMQSSASVTLSAGNADPIVIYLNQEAPEATEVAVYDENWENELTSPYEVSFGQDESGSRKEFGVHSNGEYEVKVVAEGTSDEVENAWLDSFGGFGSLSITVNSANETGAERKLDVILVGKDNAELFRMKVTQAGPSAPEGEGGDEPGGESQE